MNIQDLKTELESDAYRGMDDAAKLDALNAETQEYHVPVATSDVQNYLMTTFSSTPPLTLYNKLSLTYRNNAYPDVVRAIAESAIDLANGQIRELELHGEGYTQMAGALVQAGVWTPSEANAVLNLGRRTRSRAQDLGWGVVTPGDLNALQVQDALDYATARVTSLDAAEDAALQPLREALAKAEAPVLAAQAKRAGVLATLRVALDEARLSGTVQVPTQAEIDDMIGGGA